MDYYEARTKFKKVNDDYDKAMERAWGEYDSTGSAVYTEALNQALKAYRELIKPLLPALAAMPIASNHDNNGELIITCSICGTEIPRSVGERDIVGGRAIRCPACAAEHEKQ